jgi:hypothetical protein
MAQQNTHNWHWKLKCQTCGSTNEISADDVEIDEGMCLASCPSCQAQNVLPDEVTNKTLYNDILSRPTPDLR